MPGQRIRYVNVATDVLHVEGDISGGGDSGSINPPGTVVGAKELSKTSMAPVTAVGGVEHRIGLVDGEPGKSSACWVGWTTVVVPASQAEIEPLRLAKMKCAWPPSPPPPTGKDDGFVLATCPVGPAGKPVEGIPTVRASLRTVVLPVTAYKVDVAEPPSRPKTGSRRKTKHPTDLPDLGHISWRGRECWKPGSSERKLPQRAMCSLKPRRVARAVVSKDFSGNDVNGADVFMTRTPPRRLKGNEGVTARCDRPGRCSKIQTWALPEYCDISRDCVLIHDSPAAAGSPHVGFSGVFHTMAVIHRRLCEQHVSAQWSRPVDTSTSAQTSVRNVRWVATDLRFASDAAPA